MTLEADIGSKRDITKGVIRYAVKTKKYRWLKKLCVSLSTVGVGAFLAYAYLSPNVFMSNNRDYVTGAWEYGKNVSLINSTAGTIFAVAIALILITHTLLWRIAGEDIMSRFDESLVITNGELYYVWSELKYRNGKIAGVLPFKNIEKVVYNPRLKLYLIHGDLAIKYCQNFEMGVSAMPNNYGKGVFPIYDYFSPRLMEIFREKGVYVAEGNAEI